ncbi:MAG: L-threonine 3-dehydrogenase [Candidatus Glassbacteria bacterium]
MKALVKEKRGPGLTLKEVQNPRPGPGEVLLQVKVMSICGTDVHIYEWDEWSASRIRPPRIIGHEFAGEIIDLGQGVKGLTNGDLVTAETHIADNTCDLCRTGNAHICENVQILGIDRDGSYAELVTIPAENAWKVSPHIPLKVASVMEPIGNAVHTALAGEVVGLSALVTGCGPIGLFSIGVLKATGARTVIATDIQDYRLKIAADMGADIMINASNEDVVSVVRKKTGRRWVDIHLEMSGSETAIHQGLELLKPGGRASFLGIPHGRSEMDLAEELIFKGITLQGINGRRMFKTWFQTQSLLDSGKLDITPVLTHEMGIDEYDRGIKMIASGKVGKIVLYHS